MAISKTFQKIISEANEKDDKLPIIDELERLKAKNFKTYLTTLYSVKKLVKSEWMDEFTPKQTDLNILTKQYPYQKHYDIVIDGKVIKDIIDNRMLNWKSRLTYLLLNTGRRTMEIVSSPVKVENGILYMVLSKTKDTDFQPIDLLLNNSPKKTLKAINNLRFILGGIKPTSISSILRVYLKKTYGINPHILRGLYIRYGLLYQNPENLSIGDFINSRLNHVLNSSSANSYEHLVISDPVDYFSTHIQNNAHETKNQQRDPNDMSYNELGSELKKYRNEGSDIKIPSKKKDRIAMCYMIRNGTISTI